METNTRTNITAPVLAYFDEVAEHAVATNAYKNEWGSLVTTFDFAAGTPDCGGIVRVHLNPEDESVRIIGFTDRYVIEFELTIGMVAPLAVIRSAFESAVGLDA